MRTPPWRSLFIPDRAAIFLGGSSLGRLCMPKYSVGVSNGVCGSCGTSAFGPCCLGIYSSMFSVGMLDDGFRVRAARRRGKEKEIMFRFLQFKRRLYPVNPDISGRGPVNGGAEKNKGAVN